MVLSLETVHLVLVLIRHAGHAVVLLSQKLVHASLVGHVDLLDCLEVILFTLCGTLSESLDLSAEGIGLLDELRLIAIVLVSILSDLYRGVSDMGLQLTTLGLRVTEKLLVHCDVLLQIIDNL